MSEEELTSTNSDQAEISGVGGVALRTRYPEQIEKELANFKDAPAELAEQLRETLDLHVAKEKHDSFVDGFELLRHGLPKDIEEMLETLEGSSADLVEQFRASFILLIIEEKRTSFIDGVNESSPSSPDSNDLTESDSQTVNDILLHLEQHHRETTDALRPIIQIVEVYLQSLAGTQFATLEENKKFAAGIMRLLNRFQIKVKCLLDGCGKAAILRCVKVGASQNSTGYYQFEHYENGKRAKHCHTRDLPFLEFIEPREDKRLKIESLSGNSNELTTK